MPPRRRGARSTALAALAALTVTLAGCGGAAGGGGGDEGPVKLVGLWEVKGESAVAIDDYDHGAALGLEAVNAAGGIAGRPVELERVASDVLNPQKTAAQFLEAVDKDPAMLIGFASATALISAKSQIDRAGIPLLSATSSTAPLRNGAEGASDWTWYLQPYDDNKNEAAVRYVTDDLGASRVGLLATNDSFGTSNIATQERLLTERGTPPVAVRTYDATATDLTQSVLPMRDAQAILSFTFPNPLALELNQLGQNGIDAPVVSASSAPIAVNGKLVTGPALDRLVAAVPCDPASSTDPRMVAFRQTYQQRFGAVPTSVSVSTYDAVWIAKAAIEKAGSTEPEAIKAAMADLAVTDGVLCTGEYRADGGHMLHHEMVIVKYAADGSATEARRFTFDPLPAGA
ncbi:ABC transporter substrate-binding protein [Pseudonocardia lutea]|uniref:ABC transporter substrate-binding protein n=1 Tax=Pseudonocardia lutea TaxID=2172015 RepID=A0ABW1ICK5_9PSEU